MSVSWAGCLGGRWSAIVSFLLVVISLSFPTFLSAQISTGSVNGTVTDSSGAVVPGAKVVLENTSTNVSQTTTTNQDGLYSFLNVIPGSYTLEVSKAGFVTVSQAKFTLYVNQTSTSNFTLKVGSTTQRVTVTAGAGARINTSTSELGTVISGEQVANLPLNGRNFTQLLTLTTGVSPLNTGQNGGGWTVAPVGEFSFPAIGGQANRSNMYLVDGLNDYGPFLSTYVVAPIIDQIQEFKTMSQNDQPQFGGVVGGIVNVATKGGTNQYHGDLWEFLRNYKLDSRSFFNSDITPLKQNQFGGTLGGPVRLPHYNGRNKTFFFFGYEGTRIASSANSLYRTITPAELAGNLTSSATGQIYNPFSTAPDPNLPGQYTRQPFMCDAAGNPLPVDSSGLQATGTPCNIVPSALIDPKMVLYAKALFPAPINTGFSDFNGRDLTPNHTNANSLSFRVDENFGNKDRAFVRWSRFTNDETGSGGFTGITNYQSYDAWNVAAVWNHTFSGSSLLTFSFGHNTGTDPQGTKYTGVDSAQLVKQVGFQPVLTNFEGGLTLIPGLGVDGIDVGGGGEIYSNPHPAETYQGKVDYSKVIGKHTLQAGAGITANEFIFPCYFGGEWFCAYQTSNLETGSGGSGIASFLLGIPDGAGSGNAPLDNGGAYVDEFYFQDQWKVSSRLTLNMGLRYDLPIMPTAGHASDKSNQVGNWDFNRGLYVLQVPSPSCAVAKVGPCIPGGTLPQHVIVQKHPGSSLVDNIYDNWAPRFGFAYRLTNSTAIRAGYGRYYDTWASVQQNILNFSFSWPNTGLLGTPELNLTNPTRTAEAPFGTGNFDIPAPTPYYNSVHFSDPLAKDAESDQWHFQVERQLRKDTVLTAAYVGSHTIRIPTFFPANIATSPGPGDPQSRAPFPWAVMQPYYKTIGKASYNSLQVSLNKKASWLTYLVSYTYSKVINFASDDGFAARSVQNPNNWQSNKGVAGFDQTHRLTLSWVWSLPFGKGRKWLGSGGALGDIAGGWQLNGIGTIASGAPYTVTAPGGIPNLGGGAERPNLVGNPFAGATSLAPLNPDAFALPAPFTFGNVGRNSFRGPTRKNLDLSIFREFPLPFGEGDKLQFRWEAFNATNTPIFGIPHTSITSDLFGKVSGTANTGREMQFALKLLF